MDIADVLPFWWAVLLIPISRTLRKFPEMSQHQRCHFYLGDRVHTHGVFLSSTPAVCCNNSASCKRPLEITSRILIEQCFPHYSLYESESLFFREASF